MPIIASPQSPIRLAKIGTDDTGGLSKAEGKARLEQLEPQLEALQERLYIEGERSLLLVFQALDTGGKDGMIKQLFRSFNPNGSSVTSFKQPTEEERAHDFLWRVHPHAPPKGDVAVFNRSHYEDVLITRVHDWIDDAEWERRCEHILAFERLLADTHTTVVKFFLHISRKEQKKRLQARLDDPAKHWKFALGDLDERKLWDRYQETFEAVINRTTTTSAPWIVVPADHKWYRNVAVCQIVTDTLERLDPQLPTVDFDPAAIVIPD